MKQDLGETIKEMSEIEFPAGLHGKILRQIIFLRFRTPFIVVVTLLSLNVAISGMRVWEQIVESEVFGMIAMLWDAIEGGFGGYWQFVGDVLEIAPIFHIVFVLLNLAALSYILFYLPRVFSGSRKSLGA